MHNALYKTIGVIGGIGPIATAHFFSQLLAKVHASGDADFPRVLVDSNPAIPDRTEALLRNGPDPVPALVQAGRTLIVAGAEVLAIPCNTAHAFYKKVQRKLSVPVVNMVEAVSSHIARNNPAGARVGILATTGTTQIRLYDKPLQCNGFTPVYVSSDTQDKCVMKAIYGEQGLKSGYTCQPHQLLTQAVEELIEMDVACVILACTELSLALRESSIPLVDSSDVLAEALVREAQNTR